MHFEDKPDNIEKVIIRHPRFFTDKRKEKARYKVNELLARHFRSNGNREKAYIYAKKTEEYSILTPTLNEIIKEYNMPLPRYVLRRLGRFFR